MSIHLHEKLLTIQQLARLVPNRKGGNGVHVSTVWRWVLSGCRGTKLESQLIGGQRFSSEEALERFFQSLNRDQEPPTTASDQKLDDKPRAQSLQQDERELTAAGI